MTDAELVRRLITMGHDLSLSNEMLDSVTCHEAAARIMELAEACQVMWHPSLLERSDDK
jgi:hypothetical protein